MNRDVANNCYGSYPPKSCVAVSRFYYAALLYVKGYLHHHGDRCDAPHSPRGKEDTIWSLAYKTLDKRSEEYLTLKEFEGTYRRLRNIADYSPDDHKLTDTIIDEMKQAVNILFNGLQYE